MRHGLWSVGLAGVSLVMVLLFQNCSHVSHLEKQEAQVVVDLKPSEYLLNEQDSSPDPQKGSICDRSSGKLLDLVLNVTSLGVQDSEGAFEVGLLNQGPVIATNTRQLRFRAISPGTLRELTLRLGEKGSFVLFKDNSLAEITGTRSQDVGIQVVLDKPVDIEGGKTYDLTLEFDLEKQIQKRSHDCLFTPKIHYSKVTSVSSLAN